MTYISRSLHGSSPVSHPRHADSAMGRDADELLNSALPRPAFDDRQEMFTPSAVSLIIVGAAAGVLAALAASYLPELTDHILSIQAQGARI